MSDLAMKLRSGQPLYLHVASRLADAIAEKTYPVGSRLPTELELCKQFRTSRFTVREAVKQLQALGLVETRHGSGTEVVASEASAGRYSLSFGSVLNMQHSSRSTRLTSIRSELVAADRITAPLMCCEVGDDLLRVDALRVLVSPKGRSGKAVAITEVYILGQYAAVRDEIMQADVTIGELIERRFGISIARIEQSVEPCRLNDSEAQALDLPPGSLGLRFSRQYVDQRGQLFEFARSVQAGEHGIISMTIRSNTQR